VLAGPAAGFSAHAPQISLSPSHYFLSDFIESALPQSPSSVLVCNISDCVCVCMCVCVCLCVCVCVCVYVCVVCVAGSL
jgi:hypothetical protein